MLAELKARKDSFGKLYDLMGKFPVFGAAISVKDALKCVSVSYTLTSVLQNDTVYIPASNYDKDPVTKAAIKKIASLYKYLGECDVLVIKDDRKDFIYLRYR